MLPKVIWICGPSAVGKTTIGKELAKLFDAVHLDGDDLRHGINSDLGFSTDDRNEATRRVAHLANLFVHQGKTVVISMINALPTQRGIAENIVPQSLFIRLYADLEVLTTRDAKGIYAEDREGAPIGLGSATWTVGPDFSLTYDTGRHSVEQIVKDIWMEIPILLSRV